MNFVYKLCRLFLIFYISMTSAKTISNETASAATNQSSETPVVALFEIEQYLQHKLESITNVLTQVDNSVKSLEEKAHTWAIFQHHIEAWNEQLKALEHKLELLQRTHDEQQSFGNKLIPFEMTLNSIYSKVLYLSDNCCNNRQQQLQAPNVDGNIVDLLNELQQHGNADKTVRSEILARLANILHRVQKIESERCNMVPAHKMRNKPMEGGNRKSKELHAAKLMLPVGSCNASQRYDYGVNQTLKIMEQQLEELTSSISPKDLKQLHTLTKKNAHSLDGIAHALAETDRKLEKCQELEKKTRNFQELCQSVSGELADYSESTDLLLKRIELIVGDVNEKLERLSEQAERAKVSDVERNEDRNDDQEEVESRSFDATNETSPNINEPVESYDVNDVTDNFDTSENDTSIDVELTKVPTDIHFVQPDIIGCHELEERVDGIYKLSTPEHNEDGRDFNERFCAFATEGIAWTVIQNRGSYSEQENFNRSWLDYRNGFGQLDKDFWFGTELIHQLVYADDYELRIEMEDFEDVNAWAEYATFRLENESYNYNLLLGGYRGSVPDAMQYHNGMDFSTYDRRNDKSVDACCACATGYGSGWWFDNCSEANLNGVYHDTPLGHNYIGIVWEHWHGDYSLRKARMLIRPKYDESDDSEVATHEIYEFAEDP